MKQTFHTSTGRVLFCTPDVLLGLHGLANCDTMTLRGAITPCCSGCEMLVAFPMKELESAGPKAVIGLFDPSARAWVKQDILGFSIPWPKFQRMIENMDDCFLNTVVWQKSANASIRRENRIFRVNGHIHGRIGQNFPCAT